MPAKSLKQLKLMQAVEHNKEFADKVGIPQKVGKEFDKATPKDRFKKLKERLAKKDK